MTKITSNLHQINRVGRILALVGLLAIVFLPLLNVKPNRIAQGDPVFYVGLLNTPNDISRFVASSCLGF